MNRRRICKLGERNPSWKGDDVGYAAVHEWVRNRKKKPKLCERCGKRKAVDLANKSGKYLRDVDDYEYLCRKCHMDGDGRNEQLRKSGRNRKLPERKCPVCEKMFYNKDSRTIFCGRKCFGFSRRKIR